MKKVPYKSMSLGQISFFVRRLPEEIQFKEPGSYSTFALENKLGRKDHIHAAKL